jgi:hypothetical protein
MSRQQPKQAPRFSVLLIVLLVHLFSSFSLRGAENPTPTNRIQQVELQGRVVCLAEEMHRKHGAELPTQHHHIWGFKTPDGRCYTLLRGKFSEALFQDERVRTKELRVKARLFPESQILELTFFRSVKNGVVQDLYYYCEICAIKSVSPEVCACCQAPVILIEEPMKKGE